MAGSHKGSRLLLKDALIPVSFDTAHFNFDQDATGIQYGDLVEPLAGVYTTRPFEGRFGAGMAVEEGTTNLQSNQTPSIYNNFSAGGAMTGTLTNLTSQTGETLYGQTIWRLQMTAASGNALTDLQTNLASHGVYYPSFGTYVSGNTYASSIYWRAPKPDVVVGGTASNISGWTTIRTEKFSTGWNRSQANFFNNTGDKSDSKFWSFKSPSAQLNETITVDWACPQIELKPFSTSYVNGSRGTGLLSYGDAAGYLPTNAHTVVMWVKNYDLGRTQGWNMCFSLSPAFYLGWSGASSFLVSLVDANGVQQSGASYGGLTFQPATWYMVGYVFNNGAVSLYVNGAKVATASITATIAYQRNTGETRSLYLGGYAGGSTYFLNGIISDARIDPVARTDEEMAAWYISQAPFYSPWDYRAYAY